MRNRFLIFTFLLFSLLAHGQANRKDRLFLNAFMSEQLNSATRLDTKAGPKTILYSAEVYLAEHHLKDIRRVLTADTLRDLENRSHKESIVLTKEEKSYILRQLEAQRAIRWKDGLFPNSKLIPGDTLKSVFRDYRRWNYFYQTYGTHRIYSFTQPISLRRNTLCLLYWEYWCGDKCGQGEFTIFRKEKGSWKPFITAYSWIS